MAEIVAYASERRRGLCYLAAVDAYADGLPDRALPPPLVERRHASLRLAFFMAPDETACATFVFSALGNQRIVPGILV